MPARGEYSTGGRFTRGHVCRARPLFPPAPPLSLLHGVILGHMKSFKLKALTSVRLVAMLKPFQLLDVHLQMDERIL